MKFRHAFTLALVAASLAACNDSEDVSEDPAANQPEPVLTSAPTPTAAPDGTALVTGSWDVNENPQGGAAYFGEPETDATLAIECDRLSGTVTLAIASDATEPQAWRIDAGGEAARIDMVPRDSAMLPYLEAEIEGDLAIFHAFATPGEVVVLTSPDGERMQFPTHPGISRVLDACS